MARATQHQPPPAPAASDALRTMADAFLTIAFAGTDAGALILVNEVALLADACTTRAATPAARREAQRASVLVQASIAALTDAASKQAAATLTTSTRGTPMSEPTHEEDFLRHLTQAGVVAARIARIRFSGPGLAADIAGLRAAGYSEQTRHDDLLRQLLGDQRWATYTADPARIAAAAAITDGDRAGYDMPSLLTRVVHQRRWETDARSPSQSVARVLYYRVTREMARTLPGATEASGHHGTAARAGRTGTVTPQPPAPRTAADLGRSPVLLPQHEGKLRELLGEHRWQQYTTDLRRHGVVELITRAHRTGRDVDALLTTAVTSRPFEDDPVSPARSIADVLHYRLQRELSHPAPNESRATSQLPGQVADVLAHGNAPAGARPQDSRTDPAAQQSPPSARTAGRYSDERGSR
jgi:hypothetical protein